MHAATLKALEKTVAKIGAEIGDMTDNWVSVAGVDFWNTKHGWVRALELPDGSYRTSTSRAYAKRTGLGGVVGRSLDEIAFMGGVPTYESPAAAVRAYFGEAA
ncbi:hypothetical protein [Aminobacter sp. AP02]|uniref:hypothetical protein n=1 Tax=Aminobacter sp. AP02 TaxID=2135737 RepID=UPI000D6D5D88|nr:hypothetical protein [Aminobacter sp. AP02]PWK64631.1 hypothetical protein C8K44_11972 [Aminobacter sp. AP02]